jgi:hypothetical protein
MRDRGVEPSQAVGRLPRELLIPSAVLAAYGAVRIVAAAWGPVHDGPPRSLLSWSVLVTNLAAATQGFAAAAVLATPRRRRNQMLGRVAVGAGAVVLLGIAVWVVRGDGEAAPQVRDLLLALGFAVVTLIMCGWRPRWAAGPDGVDWSRVHRALAYTIGGGIAVGVVGLAVYLSARPAGVLHRLTMVILQLGFWGAVVTFLLLITVVGEQRRERGRVFNHDPYSPMNGDHRNDDIAG